MPAAFGIHGLLPDEALSPYNWAICDPVIQQICDEMARPTTTANRVSVLPFCQSLPHDAPTRACFIYALDDSSPA